MTGCEAIEDNSMSDITTLFKFSSRELAATSLQIQICPPVSPEQASLLLGTSEGKACVSAGLTRKLLMSLLKARVDSFEKPARVKLYFESIQLHSLQSHSPETLV